jgi:hypothetical protein
MIDDGLGRGGGGVRDCTGALLLNNAQRACDDLVVDQHKKAAIISNVEQTIHGAHPVVRVEIAVDDPGKTRGKPVGSSSALALPCLPYTNRTIDRMASNLQ